MTQTKDKAMNTLAKHLGVKIAELSPKRCIEALNGIMSKTDSLSSGESDSTKQQINSWVVKAGGDKSKDSLKPLIEELNEHMKDKTYLVGEEMTVADLVMINKVSGYMKELSKEERWSKNNFSRWYDLIQNSTDQEILSGLGVEKIKLAQPTQKSASTANPKASGEPKEKKKKEEKPKKEKAAKEAAVTVITPAMIDIRVGIIVSAEKHPDADSLYVEQIDVGEEQPRTVVSGLVKYMTLDELIGRKILVVCNLKPASMRGVKSFAMVLCTSKDDKVEFVEPHLTSVPGDRAYFEGFSGIAPEPLLNPKKKIWETIQPGLFTNGSGEAGWYDADKKFHKLCVGSDGFVCKSKSITDGIMK